ncbi:MAG: DUF2804 domain-containing protein [Solirubrobacterales bacterium]
MSAESAELPWRGPGPDRPDLPLPPDKMRLRRGGRNLKRWLYVGAFADEFLLCGARVDVGPLGQTFWVILDREAGEMRENTRLRLPGARGEVWTEDGMVRIMAGKDVRANLRPGEGRPVETVCPTADGEYTWTRKSADVPFECDVRVNGKRWRVGARGVRDESAGYHPRHTVWSWSAGIGRASDGRSVGWNLVSGINDPPERSERSIWVDGEPFEPGPVSFEGLEAIGFDDGARLGFEAECERTRDENLVLIRYSYRQPFGSFTGTLPGGLELERGLGVMEHHDAVW